MKAIPYLIVDNASSAIEFYKRAFGAVEFVRLADPSGKVMHAEIRVGDLQIMLADEFPDMGYQSPSSIGASPVSILLYIENVDQVFKSAIEAGGLAVKPVEDQFDGDRRGTMKDPFGHTWLIATRKEKVAPDEMKKRFEKMMKQDNLQEAYCAPDQT
jgi:PhnB protein